MKIALVVGLGSAAPAPAGPAYGSLASVLEKLAPGTTRSAVWVPGTEDYQGLNTSTSVTTAGQNVGRWDDQANDFALIATSLSNRATAGTGLAWHVYNGSATEFTNTTITLLAGTTIIMNLRTADTSFVMLEDSGNAANFAYAGITANASSTVANAGSPTLWVDGVSTTDTRSALSDALTDDAWHQVEYRGLDVSGWSGITLGLRVAYNGDLGGVLITTDGIAAANRAEIQAFMEGLVA